MHWGPDDLDSFPVRPGGLDGMQRRDFSGGSEHSVAGRFFPAEVQLMAFNEELFSNLSEALGRPHGVAAVAVMVQEHHREVNPAFRTIAQHLRKVGHDGGSEKIVCPGTFWSSCTYIFRKSLVCPILT